MMEQGPVQGVPNIAIEGDLGIGRNVALGGRLTTQGSVHIKRHVRIDGVLDAEHHKYVNKGLFTTAERLRAQYPEPHNGWYAYVGNSMPARMWIAWGYEWIDSGEDGGAESIYLNDVWLANEEMADLVAALGSVKADKAWTEQQLDTKANIDQVRLMAEEILQLESATSELAARLGDTTIVDRGEWQQGEQYFFMQINPATGIRETSDVWHMGCKYRCCQTATTDTPGYGVLGWLMIEGNPAFSVDFAPTDTLFDPDRINLVLEIVATLYNQDITHMILPADVTWSRYSQNAQGIDRASSDAIWTARNAGGGLSRTITAQDCDFDIEGIGHLCFRADVLLRDGKNNAPPFRAYATMEL